MSVTVKVLINRKFAESVQTTQYTVPTSTTTIIDKFTVSNNTSDLRTFSVNLVPVGESAANSNRVVVTRTLSPGETYNCPELVGQVLAQGDFISTLASLASALTIACGGREITEDAI